MTGSDFESMLAETSKVNSRPCAVLIVGADLSTGGGVNRIIRDLALMFADTFAFRTTVLSARSNAPPTYPFPASVEMKFQQHGPGLLACIKLLWQFRRRRFDYVIALWPQDNLILSAAFLFSRSRLILAEHVSWFFPPLLVRVARRLFYRLAWRVVVVNPTDFDHFRQYLSNVVMIPNPVPSRRLTAPSRREQLIIGVGHLTELKNFGDLVRAFARAGLEDLGWRLRIVGVGPQEAELRALIDQLSLRAAEICPPDRDINDWYERASILAVTSKVEVFSLVLAEAAQAGVVPVAYSADGPAFLLENFPDHLVPIGDVDALANALKIQAQRSDRGERAEAIGRDMARRFSTEVIADQWREVLV